MNENNIPVREENYQVQYFEDGKIVLTKLPKTKTIDTNVIPPEVLYEMKRDERRNKVNECSKRYYNRPENKWRISIARYEKLLENEKDDEKRKMYKEKISIKSKKFLEYVNQNVLTNV